MIADPNFVNYRLRELEAFERRSGRTTQPHHPGAAKMQAATQQVAESLDESRTRRKTAPAMRPSPNPITIVERALDRGLTGADLKEIMDLQERWDANQARKAFDIAMANAQSEIPTIVKNRLVNFEGKNGGRPTLYRHEDLAEIVETIRPILHKHGLAHRFQTAQKIETGLITVTCIITGHGHREETPLCARPDGNSSGMNDIQRIASAVTYLERYTLKAALGLAASNDDDGRASETKVEETLPPGCISGTQAEEIRTLLDQRGISHRAFLQFIKLPRIEAIGTEHFDRAVAKIKTFGGKS